MTKEEKIQFLENLYIAFNQGDLETVQAGIHPEAEWIIHGSPEIIVSGHFHGHGEIFPFFQKIFETLEINDNSAESIFGDGDQFGVKGPLTAVVRTTGKNFESRFVDIITLGDGIVVKYERFYDTLAMFRAVS